MGNILFTNIVPKVKTLAVVQCWIGIILTFIFGLLVMCNDDEVIAGLIIMIVGPLSSWISALIQYGIGQLIENSDVRTQICLEQNSQHSARES